MKTALCVLCSIVLLLAPIQSEFEKLLGEFRQSRSPVCVIYGHTLALAENDAARIKEQIVRTRNGWGVRLADGLQTVVLQAEAELSEKNGYIAGGAENLLNIYCIAVSKRCGGFNFESGMLDYGKRDYAQFMGSGKWTLYDDGQGSGRTLSDGLDRLIREWTNGAKKRSASTIGFGDLSSSEAPEYIRNACKKYKLISGHDFSVSRYEPDDGTMLLRNPHIPRELIAIPLDLMRQLPAGIDFQEEWEDEGLACEDIWYPAIIQQSGLMKMAILRNQWFFVFFSVALLSGDLVRAGNASSSGPPVVAAKVGRSGGAVVIAGKTALTLLRPNGKQSAYARAQTVASRLRGSGSGADLRVAQIGRSWWVTLRGAKLVAATRAEARAHHTTPLALAAGWRSRIAAGLATPALSLSEKEARIPLGETRRIRIGGYAKGPIQVEATQGLFAERQGETIELKSSVAGDYSVLVRRGTNQITIPVLVRKWAGAMPATVYVKFSGSLGAGALSRLAVRAACRQAAMLEPGAQVKLIELQMGESRVARTARASVQIVGPGLLSRRQSSVVEFIKAEAPERDARIFYSNDPERVRGEMTLYSGGVAKGEAARLVVHHQNGTGRTLGLTVLLTNTGPVPATVYAAGGGSGYLGSVIDTGRAAALEFLTSHLGRSGFFVTLQPGETEVLEAFSLRPNATMSGIYELGCISGEEILAGVIAHRQGENLATLADKLAQSPHSDHIYPQGVFQRKMAYSVGDRWLFMPIGREAVARHDGAGALQGNYGVVYQYNVRLSNPTDTAQRVQLKFEAAAGKAAIVMAVDGKLYQVREVGALGESRITSWVLEPGAEKTVNITTVPVSGSSYPARLIIGKIN